MEKKEVLDIINDVNRLLDDFFFKPVISTAMERYRVNNSREIRYFLHDAETYGDDASFMEEGVAELVSFKEQIRKKVLPKIEEALLVSPFHKSRNAMGEEELLYRKMMSHIFKDNVELLNDLVEKLRGIYPHGIVRQKRAPEYGEHFLQRAVARA
jgi:hypothetical protein